MDQNKSLVPSSRTNLLPALVSGNRQAINMHLRLFKEHGAVDHRKTLEIPSAERITALCKTDNGYEQIYTILALRLGQTFNNLNLRKGMNEDQLLNLAEKIIEEAGEDNLSMEDVLLFLEQLETGKAGKIYDRLDMPTFFELFESYRQDRHLAYMYRKYEIEQNYKSQGAAPRSSEQHIRDDASFKHELTAYNIQQEIKKQTNE